MVKYAALLRGINVGGRIIPMSELKQCLEKAGLHQVKTLLNSGNVTFDSGKHEPQLKRQIEEVLTQTFNYPAKVWVISVDDIKKIIEQNPFTDASKDFHQYVIFFEGGLAKDFAAETGEFTDEEVAAGEDVVYWKVQKGQTLKSHRGKLLSKSKYREFNTNRNINTLQKLVR